MFHRLATPTYFGGLPAGYDYVNNPAANGDSGTAAFADGKKASGTNAGTYFTAFSEDATSSNANRGLKALAENTDILDNLFRRDLAITARTGDVTAASPVGSFVIAAQVFVGENGVSNNQAQRDILVSVLDNNDNEIIDAGGVKVVAQLIHDGASNNVVGNQSSGFYSSPTVTLNTAIPTGTVYRVYYGERSNLATLPKDAFTTIKIRGAQEVSGDVERVLRDLHKATGATWTDPWLANINTLARRGLDGAYRLNTADPGTTPTTDVAGNGSMITRDGPAITMSLPTYLLTAVGTVGVDKYPDPILACFKLARASTVTGTTYDMARGGDVGLYQESPFHSTSDANEVTSGHVSGPLLLEVVPRDVRASTLNSNAVLTRINSTATASVNPDGLTDATSRRTIQVAASDFLRDGSGNTGLRKTDLIEVTNASNGQIVGTFRVDAVLSSTRFTVRALTGASPVLGPSGAAANVKLRWLQTSVSVGGRARDAYVANYFDFSGAPQFMSAAPGMLHNNWDANAATLPALFLSALSMRTIGATAAGLFQAMGWGGFDTAGFFGINGFLLGDGGILCSGGRQKDNLRSTNSVPFGVNDGGRTVTYNPYAGGLVIIATNSPLTTASPITFALSTAAGWAADVGDSFEVHFMISAGTVGPISVTWPGNFAFNGTDGVLPPNNLTTSTMFVKYRFTYDQSALWISERFDN